MEAEHKAVAAASARQRWAELVPSQSSHWSSWRRRLQSRIVCLYDDFYALEIASL